MTTSQQIDGPSARLARLLGYLESDPANLSLTAEAAEAAFAAGALAQTHEMLDRYACAATLPDPLINLAGLLALAEQRFADAATIFDRLRESHGDDPGIVFNLAWARAMSGEHETALSLIDDQVLAATPAAASLKIQMMHYLGNLDEALEEGRSLSSRFPANTALMGALATVAMDAEDLDLARRYALLAGPAPDGLATLGALALHANQAGEAAVYFDQALKVAPNNARALLGKGLVLMLSNQAPAAVGFIDRAAVLFDRHLGSWVASGWARFIAGDSSGARASFERALALDESFAEAQGAIAVVDIVEGRLAEGRRRADVALRLDRNCLAATLAKVLILSGEGKTETAERIRTLALNRPLDDSGRTIASAMVAFGFGAAPGQSNGRKSQ